MTSHENNDPKHKDLQEKLKLIAKELRALHLQFLSHLKHERQKETLKTLEPLEWLQLLLHAPEFKWIKPFNELMSDIDALIDRKSATSSDASIVRISLENLFFSADSQGTFFQLYKKYLIESKDLIVAQGSLKKTYLELPSEKIVGDPKTVRLSWHQKVRDKFH